MFDTEQVTYRDVRLAERLIPKQRPAARMLSPDMIAYREQRVLEEATRIAAERPDLLKTHQKTWTPADVESLKDLVRQGVAMRALPLRLGFSWRSVVTKMDELELRRKPQPNSLRYAALIRAGLSNAEIAAELGIKPDSVRTIMPRLRRQGVKVPRRKAGQAHSRQKSATTTHHAAT